MIKMEAPPLSTSDLWRKEFLGRLRPKVGSVMDGGGIIVMASKRGRDVAYAGYVRIDRSTPVSIRRWKAYLDQGWDQVEFFFDLTNETASGLLYRDPTKYCPWRNT